MGGRPFHSSMAYGSAGAGGLLFLGPLLMILFREKYRNRRADLRVGPAVGGLALCGGYEPDSLRTADMVPDQASRGSLLVTAAMRGRVCAAGAGCVTCPARETASKVVYTASRLSYILASRRWRWPRP
jgi:hypothetical protein